LDISGQQLLFLIQHPAKYTLQALPEIIQNIPQAKVHNYRKIRDVGVVRSLGAVLPLLDSNYPPLIGSFYHDPDFFN